MQGSTSTFEEVTSLPITWTSKRRNLSVCFRVLWWRGVLCVRASTGTGGPSRVGAAGGS